MTADISVAHLPDLIRQAQAGNEVLLTQDGKPVAKIVAASESGLAPAAPLQVRSLTGHRVLTPVISQSDLADEMFSRQ
jgi:antitoxin (DNA-binding transcriptional repressor) of toxin-antitoxin stability system